MGLRIDEPGICCTLDLKALSWLLTALVCSLSDFKTLPNVPSVAGSPFALTGIGLSAREFG